MATDSNFIYKSTLIAAFNSGKRIKCNSETRRKIYFTEGGRKWLKLWEIGNFLKIVEVKFLLTDLNPKGSSYRQKVQTMFSKPRARISQTFYFY